MQWVPQRDVLKRRLAEAEADVRLLRSRVREAEQRADRAEHTAREAWSFVKTIMRVGRHLVREDLAAKR
jgi:hypothetical protein